MNNFLAGVGGAIIGQQIQDVTDAATLAFYSIAGELAIIALLLLVLIIKISA